MAIKAGGKKIVISKGRVVSVTDKPSSSGGTKISVVSNSPSDVGKSFGGTPIQKSSSSGGGGGGTKISVVSDAPSDLGKSFGGTPIQTPQEYAQTSSGQALQQAQAKNIIEKIYEDPNRTDITNQTLRNKGFDSSQIAEIGRIQDRQIRQKKFEEEQAKKNLSFKQYEDFKRKKGIVSDKEIEQEAERIKLKTEVRKIENNKNLNIIEKEEKKRALFGKTAGSVKKQGLFQEPTEKELRESLNIYGVTPKDNLNKYKKLENYFSNEYSRIQNKPVNKRTNKEMFLISLYGGGAVTLGTGRKIPSVVLRNLYLTVRPDIVAKSLYELSTNKQKRGEVVTSLREWAKKAEKGDPDAISTLTSEILGYKVSSKVISESVKVGQTTTAYRKIAEEVFIRTQAKNLQPFVREIVKSARLQEKIKQDTALISKVNFKEVKELSKSEAKAIKKTLQQTDSVLFGSLASRTLTKGKTKQPKDVDLATTATPKEFFNKFLSNIPKIERNNYKLSGEAVYNKKGIKILDIKGLERLKPNMTVFGKGLLPVFGKGIYKSKKLKEASLKFPTQKLEKVEGIKLIGFGEQTTRKALGTLQVLLEKNTRRLKDPSAFIESLEIQIGTLKKQIKSSNKVKKVYLNNRLKNLENSLKILKSPKFLNIIKKEIKKGALPKDKKKLLEDISKINKKTSNLSKRQLKKIKFNVSKKLKNIKSPIKQLKKTLIKKSIKSYLPKSKLKGSYLPRSRLPKSKIPKSRGPTSKLKPSKTPVSKTPISRTPTSRVPTSKLKPSKIPVSKTPISRTPTSRTPTSKTPPIEPIKMRLNLKPTESKKTTFTKKGLFQYRDTKTKKKVTIKTNLPINKARKLARFGIDNSIQAKVKVLGYGRTKAKDIKPTSSLKFKLNKKKEEIEKNRFRLDTLGERRQISFAKAIKPSLKSKLKKKPTAKRVSRVSKPMRVKKVVSKPIRRVTTKRSKKR